MRRPTPRRSPAGRCGRRSACRAPPAVVMRPALRCDQGGTMTRPGDRRDLNPRPGTGGPAGPRPSAPEADLASRWLGSSVVAASDESFGDKENLLTPHAAAFEPGRYGNRGEIVDGWETRRRRDSGHDWVVVRLGTPGVITSVDVDTSFFTGNYPESCSVEACGCEGYPSP